MHWSLPLGVPSLLTNHIFGVVVAHWIEFGMGLIGDGNTEIWWGGKSYRLFIFRKNIDGYCSSQLRPKLFLLLFSWHACLSCRLVSLLAWNYSVYSNPYLRIFPLAGKDRTLRWGPYSYRSTSTRDAEVPRCF